MTLEDVLDVMEALFVDRDYTLEQAIENFQAISSQASEYVSILENDLRMKNYND